MLKTYFYGSSLALHEKFHFYMNYISNKITTNKL